MKELVFGSASVQAMGVLAKRMDLQNMEPVTRQTLRTSNKGQYGNVPLDGLNVGNLVNANPARLFSCGVEE